MLFRLQFGGRDVDVIKMETRKMCIRDRACVDHTTGEFSVAQFEHMDLLLDEL